MEKLKDGVEFSSEQINQEKNARNGAKAVHIAVIIITVVVAVLFTIFGEWPL